MVVVVQPIYAKGSGMKTLFLFAGIVFSVPVLAGTTVTSQDVPAITQDIAACYNTQGVGTCLQSLVDKEKIKYSAAWLNLTASVNSVENKQALQKELTEGKRAWESALPHDCQAKALLNDKDSPAFNDALSECLATGYAARIDFYNGFNIQDERAQQKKLLEKIRKDKQEQKQ